MATSDHAARSGERALSQGHGHRDNHGQTPAAWTAVIVLMAGFLLGAVAVLARAPWLFGLSVAVVLLGGVTGKVMQMMGLGQAPASHDGDDAGASSRAQDTAQRPRG